MLANQKILIVIAMFVVVAASAAGIWFLIARDSSTGAGSENIEVKESLLYYDRSELPIKDLIPQDEKMKTRDARRVADIKQLEFALEMYFDANDGFYPAALSGLVPTFIPRIPPDPLTGGAYKYCSFGTTGFNGTNSSNSDFHIGAAMEDISNVALSMDGDVAVDRCITGSFNGNATNCTGATAVTPDSCYDIIP